MEDEEQVAFELERDALADAVDTNDLLADGGRDGRMEGAEDERRSEPHRLDGLVHDARVEGLDVRRDVG